MKNKIIIAVIVLAVVLGGYYFLTGDGGSVAPKNLEAGTFSDPSGRFTFDYPAGVEVTTNKGSMKGEGFFPACDSDIAVVCGLIPKSTFPDSNFESAGFSVNTIPATSETACFTAGKPGDEPASSTMNGITYKAFTYGDTGTNRFTNGYNYRVFHNSNCYQLSTRINTSNYDVFEPGVIVRFSEDGAAVVQASFDKMLQSFKFTN